MYSTAAICDRGHVVNEDLSVDPFYPDYCPKCGASVSTSCGQCGAGYPGRPQSQTSLDGITLGHVRHDFCGTCGAPHPWVNRQGRIYALENLLREQDLPDEVERAVRKELKALESDDLSEREEIERWKKVKSLAPGLWQAGLKVVVSLATAKAKMELGLN